MNINKSFVSESSYKTSWYKEKITDTNRIKVWLTITGAQYLIEDHPDYYTNLKNICQNLDTKSVKQIEKDLNRTFPGDNTFDKQELKNILICYSARNPNVGYVQGFNFVVAVLLGFRFSEEEAFWIFVQIIEKYLPFEYFTSMSGVILDQKVFDFLFRLKLQKICRHVESLGVESCLFTVQWFICMYSFTFNKEIVASVWDLIFTNGSNSLFHIGLAILWVLRKEILRKKDFFQVLDCVERGCKELTDFSEFKLALNKKNLRIKSGLIIKLRNIYEDEVLAEYSEKFNRVIDPYVLIRSINQYCKDDNECKQKVLFTSGFFTFKLCDVSVIDGFIDNHSYPKIVNSSYLRENEQIYTFGKKNHCCLFEPGMDEFSDDEEEINFIRRNTGASVKKSFAQISSKVNFSDFE